ncbi:TrkH family potassium uptake protein [Pseudooceanicola nanhaiensis]|uniref:TrkH family potassium uptake protein n=1 Tax=Pseudooceanicola nanhaiensis TaxID=375761 RepID=UPI001CD7E6E1|nr:potassium transporter TrkG [Pseudooceanicola nanhaiensis]MCA0920937.1 TrkH family potassium uptake protein [Pseudooceanicola nanhaiensis]
MLAQLEKQPILILLTGITCTSMLVPALVALIQQDHLVARSFLYTALLGNFICVMIGIARSTTPRPRRKADLQALLGLLLAFLLLPIVLAVPFHEGLRTTTFTNAYFEMVSSFTTTGATLFREPGRLPEALHLWRAQVGWMGGLLIWLAAAAIMAPLSLGGFEVTSAAPLDEIQTRLDRFDRPPPTRRLLRLAGQLAPVYVGLTALLCLLLLISGERPMIAVTHAMSTLSTSGISLVGGLKNGSSGFWGEVLIFLFLIFALSRSTFANDTAVQRQAIHRDPELRLAAVIIVGVPLLLFLRHWIGAFDVKAGEELGNALGALWGSVFTVISFLSTTGFESASWETAQNWSGLNTPGEILMGLAIMGGGVATTAGGVKLMRVFALYLNGLREMERLVHPSSISGMGTLNRRMSRDGAFHAWLFFMLFAITIAVGTAVLALLGSSFEAAMVLAIAALTNTGPLINMAADVPVPLIELGDPAKLVLCLIMIMGRLELLAIIALANADLWRD